MRNLRRFGLNGMVNCQALRVFFPTGLGMVTMGRSLWDSALEFDAIAADYFPAAYGEDGPACGEFMAETERLSAEIVHRFRAEDDAAEPIEDLRGLVDGFGPVLERNESAGPRRVPRRVLAADGALRPHHARVRRVRVREGKRPPERHGAGGPSRCGSI